MYFLLRETASGRPFTIQTHSLSGERTWPRWLSSLAGDVKEGGTGQREGCTERRGHRLQETREPAGDEQR